MDPPPGASFWEDEATMFNFGFIGGAVVITFFLVIHKKSGIRCLYMGLPCDSAKPARFFMFCMFSSLSLSLSLFRSFSFRGVLTSLRGSFCAKRDLN